MIWNDKIFDEIDKEELELLCNPLENFDLEEDNTIYFIVVFY